MAYQKKSKGEEKTVAWMAPKRKTIKFEGDEDSLQIADNVMEKVDFEKFPIIKGDIVEVSVKDEEVIFLKKVDAKKEEKVEIEKEVNEEPNEKTEIKTITVEAVRKDKTALKEGGGSWPKISENLQGNEAFQRGATIEVKMQGDTIVAVKKQEKVESKVADKVEQETKISQAEKKVVADPIATQETKKITVTKSETAISIESQQALKEAVNIVKMSIEKDNIEEKEIIRLIKVYTKACYEAMQEV